MQARGAGRQFIKDLLNEPPRMMTLSGGSGGGGSQVLLSTRSTLLTSVRACIRYVSTSHGPPHATQPGASHRPARHCCARHGPAPGGGGAVAGGGGGDGGRPAGYLAGVYVGLPRPLEGGAAGAGEAALGRWHSAARRFWSSSARPWEGGRCPTRRPAAPACGLRPTGRWHLAALMPWAFLRRPFFYIAGECGGPESRRRHILPALGRFQGTDPPRRKNQNAGGVGQKNAGGVGGTRSGRSCRARRIRTDAGGTLSLDDESKRDIGSPLGTLGSSKTIFYCRRFASPRARLGSS